MRCFKLLGERGMSRGFDRQVAELQIRAAILNRFAALGTPITSRAGQVGPGKAILRSSADLRNMCNRPVRKRYLRSCFWRVIGC